jgi:pimeloyl-ACP methyl ester carboxylesterase
MSSQTSRRGAGQVPPSRWVDLDGPVHFVDYGGPDEGPLLVCVHGLGGSLVNWAAVGPALSATCRVLALDLAGFGRTQGGRRSTSVPANRALLHRFLVEVAGTPAILVGNSMGGAIAALQASVHPETVAGAVLVDPALPTSARSRSQPLVAAMFGALVLPVIGPSVLALRRRTRTSEQLVMDLLRLCCEDPSRVPADIVEQHLALARDRRQFPNVDVELLIAGRSLMWLLTRRRRFAAMLHGIRVPVLLLHGDRDRLVPIGAARAAAAANPSWRLEVAQGVGHVPQLEVPEWTVGHILEWLRSDGAAAADLARGAVDI